MSNRRWNPLPPISRTPSPPACTPRHTQSYGGALTALPEDPEDAEWDDEGPSTPAAPAEPPRKKRKTRKRFLSLRKDPEGKWKRRKERAAGKEEEDEDMLDSINVAGGFLMIGDGSANPRAPPDRGGGGKNRWEKTSTVESRKGKGKGVEKATTGSKRKGRAGSSKMEVPSLESRITYPKKKIVPEQDKASEMSGFKGEDNKQIPEFKHPESLKPPEKKAPIPDSRYEIPSSIPSSDSGTPTPPNNSTPIFTDPAPPEPPPSTNPQNPQNPQNPPPESYSTKLSVPPAVTWPTAPSPPPPNPQLYDLAKKLTFRISAFPDLRKFWTIYGRDLFPSTSSPKNNFPTRPSSASTSPTTSVFPTSATEPTGAGPSYAILSIILTRKLSTPVTPSRRILINYYFPISTQAELDDCIARLVYYKRPTHDIVLMSVEDDTKGVIDAMRCHDREFWRGRKEGSPLPETVLIAAEAAEAVVGEAEVNTSGKDSGAAGRKGKGREVIKDARVLSNEFVEPEDDYSEDEDMGMRMEVEIPDSISPSLAEPTTPLVLEEETLTSVVSGERQTLLRISPAPPSQPIPQCKLVSGTETEKVPPTTPTRSLAGGNLDIGLTTPLLAAAASKNQEEGTGLLQKPTQTQYAGHELSNERSNPSPVPAPVSGGKGGKRKLEDCVGSPVTRETRAISNISITTVPPYRGIFRRGKRRVFGRAAEDGTQTNAPTKASAGEPIAVISPSIKEGEKDKRSMFSSRTSPGLSTSVPLEAGAGSEGGLQKVSPGESNMDVSTPPAAQEKGGASLSIKQVQEVSRGQNHNPMPWVEGPDNTEVVASLKVARGGHETIQGGVTEKDLDRNRVDGNKGNSKVPVVVGAVVDVVSEEIGEGNRREAGKESELFEKRNNYENLSNDVSRKEKGNSSEGGAKNEKRKGKGKGKEKEKAAQLRFRERKIAPKPKPTVVPIAPKIGDIGAFRAGANTVGIAGAGTHMNNTMPSLALIRASASTTGGAARAGAQTSTISAPTLPVATTDGSGSLPTYRTCETVGAAEVSNLPSREHDSQTPSIYQSRVHMRALSPPAQTREERFKAVVAAAAAAANDSGSEGRFEGYQRAARSTGDASKIASGKKTSKIVQRETGIGDVDMDREFAVHHGRLSVRPLRSAEESGSTYTPSEQGSITNSTTAGIAEAEAQLQLKKTRELQRERSEGTVEAATILNAVATPHVPEVQPIATNNSEIGGNITREDDGQSVDIMHGADLLLWAAGAVDTNFSQHIAPLPSLPPNFQQQQDIARAIFAATTNAPPAKRKYKSRKPKDSSLSSEEPKLLKEGTKAKVTKTKVSRRKSLIVTLKVPSVPTSVDGDSPTTNSPPNDMPATSNTPPPTSPPNWPIPSLGFTPVNPPKSTVTASIPRPQPYRKPETAMPRPIAMKPLISKPRTSSIEALAAARKQTEQAKFSRFKGIGTSKSGSNIPSLVGASSPIAILPTPDTPVTPTVRSSESPVGKPMQPASPKADPPKAITTPQRPAYAKPNLRNTGSPGSPETLDIDIDHPLTLNDAPPTQLQPFSPVTIVHSPTHPIAERFFASFNNNSRSDTLDGASNNPRLETPVVFPTVANASEQISAGISAAIAARSSPPVTERVIPARSPALSADVTRQTTPLPLTRRSTLTPEYIETKKVMPLVGKNNFLYWDPSMAKGPGGADVKVPIGETTSASMSPITAASSALASSSGSILGSVIGSRSLYQSPPPLKPLSDIVRSTTAPPLQSRVPAPPLHIPAQSLPQQQRPTPHSPVLPNGQLKPADMRFKISRYEKADQKMIVYGHEILADSSETFVWDKLVRILEIGIQFDDFRESLIVNFHHMVEDEVALNEGLGWYRRDNEVVVARVDSFGKPPKPLAERMKRERKMLRERGIGGSPV